MYFPRTAKEKKKTVRKISGYLKKKPFGRYREIKTKKKNGVNFESFRSVFTEYMKGERGLYGSPTQY